MQGRRKVFDIGCAALYITGYKGCQTLKKQWEIYEKLEICKEKLHLPINRPNLVRFSKFLFLQKAYENRHLAKYWVRSCAPCAPASAAPVFNEKFSKKDLLIECTKR